ncbi:MAG: response regulator [bacterium]
MIKKILIIDDDYQLSEEIAEILEEEGFEVGLAFNGLGGEKLLEKNNYDLLLLDLNMPGLTGFDVLRNINKKNIKLNVFVITGWSFNKCQPMGKKEIEEEETLKLADKVISKPFNIEELLQMIKQLEN